MSSSRHACDARTSGGARSSGSRRSTEFRWRFSWCCSGSPPPSAPFCSSTTSSISSTVVGTPGRRWARAERAAYLTPFADRAVRDRSIRLLRALLVERDYLRATEENLRRVADRPLLALFGERDAAR